MTKTHKDNEGILRCDDCSQILVWAQTKAGKWYLADGQRAVENTSTRYEYGMKVFAVATLSPAVSHFRTCRGNKAGA